MSDLSGTSTELLEHECTTLAAQLSAATCRWLLVVGELDRREAWLPWGCRSMAHWLSMRCGIALGTARDQLRVAARLTSLPLVRAAFAEGRVSYSQVRALVRLATPVTEADLLDLARHATGAQLEQLLRAKQRVDRAVEEGRYAARDVAARWDDDGCLVVRARLSPEEGALLLAGMGAAEGASAETAAGRRADAFMALVRGGMGEGPAIPAEISVVVEADGSGHLDDGPALAPESVELLACDAAEVVLVEDAAGNPLDAGRRQRRPNRAQRRSVHRRDQGRCRFPGCPARRFVDVHHVDWWVRDEGETNVDVLVSLCRFHHRQVHLERLFVRTDPVDGFVFCRADGEPIVAAHLHGDGSTVTELDRIDERTGVPQWAGDHLDLDLALTALFSREGAMPRR